MSAHDVSAPICLSTDDAARKIGISSATLRRLTHEGSGPPSIVVGKKRRLYPDDDLRAWVRSQKQRSAPDEHA
ncbi:helix-turn-helix domain-containing protein [Acetobacter musti]|uniref:Helix-turn-helix domain-containing protein n=1 Tax=Acetobacter musti TaxID=864732 RepID=A0ABX0JVJ0_9PROT|nr:helix-turn-helix domain-containing protein [Acetobacter musti]NHN85882.1 helix-turn-helix domain-containing protein [Acetobacter musti]